MFFLLLVNSFAFADDALAGDQSDNTTDDAPSLEIEESNPGANESSTDQDGSINTRIADLERQLLLMEAELITSQSARVTPVAPQPVFSPNALNPSITAFGDLFHTVLLHDGDVEEGSGWWLRSLELDVRAAVDPHANAVAVIAFEEEPAISLGEDHGHEVEDDVEEREEHGGGVTAEEVYVDLVALPFGLSGKVGRFRQPFGVINKAHPHDYPWPDTPLAISESLGEHGLTDIGALLRWRGGLGETAAVTLEAGSIGGEFLSQDSGEATNSYLARAELFASRGFFDLTLGASGVSGGGSSLYGADFSFRWRPSTRRSLVLLSEAIRGLDGEIRSYVSAQAQFSREFYLGGRVDIRESPEQIGGYLSYYASEFLRLRSGVATTFGEEERAWLVNSQLTFVWGAHPVEPYWVNR